MLQSSKFQILFWTLRLKIFEVEVKTDSQKKKRNYSETGKHLRTQEAAMSVFRRQQTKNMNIVKKKYQS